MDHQAVIPISVPCPVFEGRNSVYVLPGEPITLIDTGIASDKAYRALVAGLREQGIEVADIQRVILTHKHVDHIGNAWRVQRESGAAILIHELEVDAVTDVDPAGERFGELLAERLEEWNVPEHDRPQPRQDAGSPWTLESAAADPLHDGQQLDAADGQLEIIHTPGHTMGSICLKYGDVLFSGDHVLPNITPNVGGGDMRRRGLLRRFLDSLDLLGELPANTEVFPGHGAPFTNLRQRIDGLKQHHDQRLEATLGLLRDGPRDVYEVARGLFPSMSDYHVVLGCAETHAHLELLIDQGQVVEEQGRFRVA